MKKSILTIIAITLCVSGAALADTLSTSSDGKKIIHRDNDGNIIRQVDVPTSNDSPQFYGDAYTTEQAKQFGYYMESASHLAAYANYSEKELYELAEGGDATVIQRLTMVALNGDKPKQAVQFGAMLAATYGNTYLLNNLGDMMLLGEGDLETALVAFQVAAYVGDHNSAGMSVAMQNKLGPERSKKPMAEAKRLYHKYASEAGYPSMDR